jgi:hypothetical protein
MRAGRLLLQRNRQTDLWEICVTEGSGTLNDSGAALRGKSYDNRSFDSGRNLAYAAWRRADAKASALWTQAVTRGQRRSERYLPTSGWIGNRSARGDTLNDRRRTDENGD